MDPVKEAFSKIKKDMDSLNLEIDSLKSEFSQTREELIKICQILIELNNKITKTQEKKVDYPSQHTPAQELSVQTTPTHNPTHGLPLNPLKGENIASSTGNEGVPTDRQTDRQTDNTKENAINNAAKMLDSLDSIKKEVRLKFKRLTSQEMLVFSTLYQLEEETGQVDYKVLAKRLHLTESSVRDYIGRLIQKGIPVEKNRLNNKTIILSVSSNLKRITSLSTIMQLRDL